jgi:hypothetical protein
MALHSALSPIANILCSAILHKGLKKKAQQWAFSLIWLLGRCFVAVAAMIRDVCFQICLSFQGPGAGLFGNVSQYVVIGF